MSIAGKRGHSSPIFLAHVYCSQTVVHLCCCWALVNINHTAYHLTSSLNTKTYMLSLKLMTFINIRHQTSRNHELLLDWQREVCNSYTTKIVWILTFCSIKVLTIGVSRNQLPIFKKSIANTNTYLEKVLQYSGNTEKSIGNTANTNTILQY